MGNIKQMKRTEENQVRCITDCIVHAKPQINTLHTLLFMQLVTESEGRVKMGSYSDPKNTELNKQQFQGQSSSTGSS